jgi:hypothetical protein
VHSVRVSRKYFGARQRAFDRSGPITPHLSPPRVKGKRPLPNLHRSSSLVQMELVEFHGLVFFFKKKNGVSRTKPPPTSATKICAPRERPD